MRALTFGMAAVGLSLIGGAAAAQAPEAKWGDGGVSAFYTWTGPLPDRPGVMLRAEPLPAALMLANAAAGERILYTSTDGVTGTGVISVSGVLYLPKGAPPKGG